MKNTLMMLGMLYYIFILLKNTFILLNISIFSLNKFIFVTLAKINIKCDSRSC